MSKNNLQRIVVYGLLLIVCSGYFFFFHFNDETSPNPNPIGLKRDEFNLKYSSLRSGNLSPEDFAKQAQGMITLLPDKRLLSAIGQIPGILSSRKIDKHLSIIYVEGKFQLKWDKETFATVDAELDWNEYFELSKRLLEKEIPSQKFHLKIKTTKTNLEKYSVEISSFDQFKILKALHVLNGMYAKDREDLEVFRLISRGTTILALHTASYFLDTLSLESKALAMFTILKKFSPTDIVYDELLISQLLGYQDHLYKISSQLPPEQAEFFKCYLQKDYKKLDSYVLDSHRNPHEVFTYMQAYGDADGADSVLEYAMNNVMKKYGVSTLPFAMKALLKRYTFSYGTRIAVANLDYILHPMIESSDSYIVLKLKAVALKLISIFPRVPVLYKFYAYLMPNSTKLIDEIDSLITAASKNFNTGLFDNEDYELFMRSSLYDPLAKIGNFATAVQNNNEATGKYIELLSKSQNSYAKLLVASLQASSKATFDVIQKLDFYDAVAKYKDLAGHRLYSIFTEITRNTRPSEPQIPIATILLNMKLDNRPQHSPYLNHIYGTLFFDQDGYEKILRRDYRLVFPTHFEKMNQQVNEGERFEAITLMQDKELLPQEKIRLLMRLNLWSGLDIESKSSLYENAIELEKQNFSLVQSYAALFNEQKDYSKMREIVLKYAPNFESANDLNFSNLRVMAATASMYMKEYEQAQSDIEPVIVVGSGNVLVFQSDLAAAQGKYDEAIKIISKTMARYDTDVEVIHCIKYLLLAGNHTQAADLFFKRLPKINVYGFYPSLSKKFHEILKEKPDFDFTPFLDMISHSPEIRYHIPGMFIESSKNGLFSSVEKYLGKYDFEKSLLEKNIFEARYSDDWPRFTDKERIIQFYSDVFRNYLFSNRVSEGLSLLSEKGLTDIFPYLILWHFQEMKDEDVHLITSHLKSRDDKLTQYVMLFLAGKYIQVDKAHVPFNANLKEYFSDPSIPSFYYKLGRYMLSLEEKQSVEALADSKRRISLYYYYGVKSLSRYDYRSTEKWWKAALMEGTYAHERYWMLQSIDGWYKNYFSRLGRLKKANDELQVMQLNGADVTLLIAEVGSRIEEEKILRK